MTKKDMIALYIDVIKSNSDPILIHNLLVAYNHMPKELQDIMKRNVDLICPRNKIYAIANRGPCVELYRIMNQKGFDCRLVIKPIETDSTVAIGRDMLDDESGVLSSMPLVTVGDFYKYIQHFSSVVTCGNGNDFLTTSIEKIMDIITLHPTTVPEMPLIYASFRSALNIYNSLMNMLVNRPKYLEYKRYYTRCIIDAYYMIILSSIFEDADYSDESLIAEMELTFYPKNKDVIGSIFAGSNFQFSDDNIFSSDDWIFKEEYDIAISRIKKGLYPVDITTIPTDIISIPQLGVDSDNLPHFTPPLYDINSPVSFTEEEVKRCVGSDISLKLKEDVIAELIDNNNVKVIMAYIQTSNGLECRHIIRGAGGKEYLAFTIGDSVVCGLSKSGQEDKLYGISFKRDKNSKYSAIL